MPTGEYGRRAGMYSTTWAAFPETDWNYHAGGVWCGNDFYFIEERSYSRGSYWGGWTPQGWGSYEENWMPLLWKMTPQGSEMVIGGFTAIIDRSLWGYPSGVPDGYGPHTSLSTEVENQSSLCSDDTYIYYTNQADRTIRRFNPETLFLDTILGQHATATTNPSAITDGDLGVSATLWPYGPTYHDGWVYFWDGATTSGSSLRRISTSSPYTVETLIDHTAHSRYPFGDDDWAWASTINSTTGLPHYLDSDFTGTDLGGLFYHGGYLFFTQNVEPHTPYIGTYPNGYYSSYQPSALRRIPISTADSIKHTGAGLGFASVQEVPPVDPGDTYQGAAGQSFTTVEGGTLQSVKFYLTKSNNPTDEIRAVVSDSMGGTALGTSTTVSGTSISSSPSYAWYAFTFTGGVALDAATKYYVWLERTGPESVPGTNYYMARKDWVNPFSGGEHFRYDGGWETVTNEDMIFELVLSQGWEIETLYYQDYGEHKYEEPFPGYPGDYQTSTNPAYGMALTMEPEIIWHGFMMFQDVHPQVVIYNDYAYVQLWFIGFQDDAMASYMSWTLVRLKVSDLVGNGPIKHDPYHPTYEFVVNEYPHAYDVRTRWFGRTLLTREGYNPYYMYSPHINGVSVGPDGLYAVQVIDWVNSEYPNGCWLISKLTDSATSNDAQGRFTLSFEGSTAQGLVSGQRTKVMGPVQLS